jgi:hypothetical protein
MKNLMLFLFLAVTAISASAQTGTPDYDSNIKECMCCQPYYNLPKTPPISGPTHVSCTTSPVYSTTTCPGANIVWTVTPAIAFTGQGTPSIHITGAILVSSYTVTVTISCGNKKVSNTIQVQVEQAKPCCPDFLLSTQEISATLFQVNGTPSASCPTLGFQHFWVLSQISNCSGTGTVGMSGWTLGYTAAGAAIPQPNPAITPGPSGNGYQYPGLAKGQCYTLTHYIYCCGQWKYQKKCFCMNNARMAGRQAEAQIGVTETSGTVEFNQLPKEVQVLSKN